LEIPFWCTVIFCEARPSRFFSPNTRSIVLDLFYLQSNSAETKQKERGYIASLAANGQTTGSNSL
jgi:hypothetical protein